MAERLLSVGLDVGTTTSQMIVSELVVENRGSPFAVPDLAIVDRVIRYKSPVYFTPLLDDDHVDAAALREIVTREYAAAGIERAQVDTGAIIITGETARKENARAVLSELSGFAGDFVVATAGPDLESVLAARGAGADAASERLGKSVLHMDIGGGTANLALAAEGKIVQTGCLNVGGRLLKFDPDGRILYVSPVLRGLTELAVGQIARCEQVEDVAKKLTHALEMAAGLRQRTELLDQLITNHTVDIPPEGCVPSFSGGVADCIAGDYPWLEFGDMGPKLGRCIRESRLCAGEYLLGQETIRATVIGAGCHSATLSGSTVFCRNMALPVQNLPAVVLSRQEQELPPEKLSRCIRRRMEAMDGAAALAMPGICAPDYDRVRQLARGIAGGIPAGMPVIVVLEQDMAKALGQALALLLPQDTPCLCLDRLRLGEESYLDVGQSVGSAYRVVIKTVILSQGDGKQ